MVLSGFDPRRVRRVRVTRYGFVGAQQRTVDEITVEIEHLDGDVRYEDIRLGAGGINREALDTLVRRVNRELDTRHGE